MQERLPQVIHIDSKRNSQPIANKYRLRKAINKKYEWIDHSLPLPDLSFQQLISFSIHNLHVLPRKKTLCDSSNRSNTLINPPTFNKKVLIFNQRALNAKYDQITDLKTCKSLLNPKSMPKKMTHMFVRGHRDHRYTEQSIRSLWDITDQQPQTDPLKYHKDEDFDLQPWNNDDSSKQNHKFYA